MSTPDCTAPVVSDSPRSNTWLLGGSLIVTVVVTYNLPASAAMPPTGPLGATDQMTRPFVSIAETSGAFPMSATTGSRPRSSSARIDAVPMVGAGGRRCHRKAPLPASYATSRSEPDTGESLTYARPLPIARNWASFTLANVTAHFVAPVFSSSASSRTGRGFTPPRKFDTYTTPPATRGVKHSHGWDHAVVRFATDD